MSTGQDHDYSERELAILKLLVDMYISDGQPVGSRTLSRLPGVRISAASVRNVMGDLEQMGLLKSPHTSAGRVPTSKAYRLFVDSMLEVKPLQDASVRALREALDPNLSEPHLIKTASAYLSTFTQMAGMVTTPRHDDRSTQQIEFIPLSYRRVLTILIHNDREVQNRIIHVERDYTKDELDTLARTLNGDYLDATLPEVRDRLHRELQNARNDMSSTMQLMIDVAGQVFDTDQAEPDDSDMVVAGETNLMAHHDLQDVAKLRELFEAFQQKRDLYHLLERCLSGDGVQIFIGRESGYDPLGECSLITSPYTVDDKVIGVLGVVGPKRMAYDQVISVVDVTSRLLSAALNAQH